MMYIISNKKNSYGTVEFDHDCFDSGLFNNGSSLKSLITEPLRYQLNKKISIKGLSKFHIIRSTGPELVSNKLREIIEGIAPEEVEFFDADIYFDGQKIDGFSCINPLKVAEAVDLEKSEYRVDGFDTEDPEYDFYFMVIKDEIVNEPNIARCYEFLLKIIVNARIKEACFNAGLKGLVFYRSLDLTPKFRSVYDEVK